MSKELVLKNRIREARLAAHMSQAELGKAADVSRQTINSIENGQFSPTAKLALVLCTVLEKKFEELFYF